MSASPLQETSLARLATSKMLKTTLNLKGGGFKANLKTDLFEFKSKLE